MKPGAEPIRIVAPVILDESGRILLVRKRGTRAFMQPGGKVAPGESSTAALARELADELGCALEGGHQPLGRFTAAAANEPGFEVEAELFAVSIRGVVAPAAEIEEAIWYDPGSDQEVMLAPLTLDHVLPLIRVLR